MHDKEPAGGSRQRGGIPTGQDGPGNAVWQRAQKLGLENNARMRRN